MLGERRSNSLFAPTAPAEPERKPEQAEVHDISFEERTGRSLFAENATAPRASELFFAPQEKGVTFAEALSQVQGYLAETYATLITEDNSDAKEQMKRRMARYLQENRIAVDGMTASELVDALYTEMAEYGFLTKYIFADGIEEIDINSWRDIEIQYSDGHTAKLEEHFDSPEHAANVIRRMLQNSGKVLDNASPIITSRLAKNIRISVIKTPVLDEDAGVAASIRVVNPRNLSKADFVQSGTATEEMLDFLSACLRYGVSICVAGATSSGKTTVAGWLLSTIPDRKRIFTIEDGSRELQLIRERDGRVTNSVVHTQTRDSENERQRIDQIALLDIALRFNPDIICVGEMRGPEANAAQEAARVGIAVLTTIHSNSSEGTYRRMVSLCKRAVDTRTIPSWDMSPRHTPLWSTAASWRTSSGASPTSPNARSCRMEVAGFTSSMSITSRITIWRATVSSLRASTGNVRRFPRACGAALSKMGCRLESWRNSFKERRKMNDYDPADCLHRHDRRAFYGTACLAARTERQSFFPLDRSSRQYPCRYQRNDQAKKGRVPPA